MSIRHKIDDLLIRTSNFLLRRVSDGYADRLKNIIQYGMDSMVNDTLAGYLPPMKSLILDDYIFLWNDASILFCRYGNGMYTPLERLTENHKEEIAMLEKFFEENGV